jgi:hypothetical protein
MEKMRKEFVIVVVGIILLSVLAVMPVMSEAGDGNVTNVSEATEDIMGMTDETTEDPPSQWEGTTSQGKAVSFKVNDTHISGFMITYDNPCNVLATRVYISYFPVEIVENVFQYEVHGDAPYIGVKWIYGKFTSPTSASGTFRNMWEEQGYSGATCDTGNITWSATLQTTTKLMEGDVTMDEHVTMADAMFIAQYKAGLRSLNASQLTCADTTDDGDVTMADAMHIAQWKADPDGTLGVLFKPLWSSENDADMLEPVDC